MKMKKLLAALEDYQEPALPEHVIAQADVGAVDPQPVVIIEQVSPVEEIPAAPDEVVAEVAPVEEVPVIELGAPTDFQEHVEAMDGVVAEQIALNNDIDNGMAIQQSMEAYMTLLQQSGPDGVSRQTAGFLRVGLEAFHGKHLDLSDLILSMEDMGNGEKQHLLPSKINRKEIGKKFMDIVRKVIEYVKQKWAKAKEFTQHLAKGIPLLERKMNKVGQAASKFNGMGKDFTVPKPERLAMGDKISQQFPKSLMAVTALAVDNYPQRMVQFYNGLASALSNFSPQNNNASEVADQLTKAVDVLGDLKASEEVLPGNVRIDVSESGVSYGIAEAGQGGGGEHKLRSRQGSAITSDVKIMTTILGFLKKYPQYQEKVGQAAEKVAEGLTRMEKFIEGTEMDETAKEAARKLVSGVNEVLHKANPRGDEIVKYLVRTMSAYCDMYLAEMAVGSDAGVEKGKEVATA